MFRKTMTTAITLLLVLTFVGIGAAMEEGNKRKGKYTYRKVYKSCFDQGGCASETPPLGPNAKTQAEWEKIFGARDFAAFGCSQEWAQLSDEDVKDIFAYLHAHASDSPTPLSCK
jgi:hypothetical protein